MYATERARYNQGNREFGLAKLRKIAKNNALEKWWKTETKK